MDGRLAMAGEIQTWLKGGKRRRTLTMLQRATGIHRNTLSDAAAGLVDLTGYHPLRILKVISTPERMREFVQKYMPELFSMFEMMSESTFIAASDMKELECKILTDVVCDDFAMNTLKADPKAEEAVSSLIQKKCLEQVDGVLKAASGLLIANRPITYALAKFAAKKLNVVQPGNYGTVWIANCSDETREIVIKLVKEIEIRTAEISKLYKPGPHKVAMVAFATNLGDFST